MDDLKIPYELAKSIVKEKGFQGWLEHLQGQFPNYKLYSVSKDWFNSSEYICKAKGMFGDVIVGWIHHL